MALPLGPPPRRRRRLAPVMGIPLGSNRFLSWTPADQTVNRAVNTDYQNTSGTVRMVMVGVECTATALGEAMAGFQHVVSVDRLVGFPAGVAVTGRFAFTFVVPIGATYRVNTFVAVDASVVLERWIEVDL